MKIVMCIVLLVIAVIVCPALASQTAIGTMTGNNNSHQTVLNLNGGTANMNPVFESTNTYYSINNDPSVFGLDVGQASFTRLVYPNEIVTFPIHSGTSYSVISGTPIAVYTVDWNGLMHVKGEQSMLIYDPIYNKMDHGTVIPIDMIPYYTTKCGISTSGDATHLVIDNRYFPAMSMVEVAEIE